MGLHAMSDRAAHDDSIISDFVARVKVPTNLKVAISAWRALQQQYLEAHTELRRLIGENKENPDAPGRAARERAIGKCGETVSRIAEEVRPALRRIRDEREPFLAALQAALRPIEATAARKAMASLVELEQALGELDEIGRALETAGDEPRHYLHTIGGHLLSLRTRLGRILS